jgi:tetratricopeptide (TPR) repeat protein
MSPHRIQRLPRSWRRGALAVCLSALSFAVFGTASLSAPEAYAAKKDKDSSKTRTDPRELQAREAFAASRYRDALDLYAKLYAEKLHPTYLRNIGRCHQNMGNPEEAIASFRDYLRKAPDLPASERQEVEGFISEMEALREKQKQDHARQQTPQPVVAVTPPPVAPPGGAAAGGAAAQPAGLNLQDAGAQPQPEQSPPFYKRTWFWVATGVVAAAAVVTGLWAGGVFSSSTQCRAGYNCQPSN